MSGDLTAAHEENERIQFELCEAQAELPKIGELEKELEEIAAQLNDVTFQVFCIADPHSSITQDSGMEMFWGILRPS